LCLRPHGLIHLLLLHLIIIIIIIVLIISIVIIFILGSPPLGSVAHPPLSH